MSGAEGAAAAAPTGEDHLQTHVVDVTGLEKRTELCNGLRTNDLVLVHGNKPCRVIVEQNQRLRSLCLLDNDTAHLSVLDSAVVCTRSLRVVGCTGGDVLIEDADVRRIELWSSRRVRIVLVGDAALVENVHVLCHAGCEGVVLAYAELRQSALSFAPRCEVVREAVLPAVAPGDESHVVLARCARPPELDVRVLAADDPHLLERLAWLARFAPALEFATAADNARVASAPGQPLASEAAVRSALRAVVDAHYAVSEAEVKAQYEAERAEYEEDAALMRPKVREVARLLRAAEHCVVYTGAGISTAAEIPDFRGPNGVWTCEDRGERPQLGKDIQQTRPTYAHYALTELARRGLVKFVVTTNMDGLHWRTGLPPHMLEELHGSAYTEHCPRCHAHYRRATEVDRGAPDHKTGNRCDWCGEELLDTIVNFSDTYRSPLEPVVVDWHSHRADLAIVMGTSCFVQPAASYPEKVVSTAFSTQPPADAANKDEQSSSSSSSTGAGHTLVVVNLQPTPLDSLAGVRIYSTTDRFAKALMEELGIDTFDTKYDAMAVLARAAGTAKAVPEQKCVLQ